jgi:ATP-binding cassette subfamily B protein
LTLPFLAGAQLVAPYLLRVAIDRHITPAANGVPGALDGLWTLILFLLAVLVVEVALRFAQLYLMQIAGQRIMHDLRMAVFGHVQKLSMSYFDHHPVGQVMTRVTSDVETLNELMSQGLVAMVRDVVTLVGIVAVMTWIDWRLTVASFVVFPFLAVILGALRIRLRRTYNRARTLVARLNAFLQESITGMGVIQAFDQQARNVAEFKGHRDNLLNIDLRGVGLSSFLSASVQSATTVSTALVLAYGGFGVIGSTVTIGILVQFMEYLGRFYRPLEDLSDKYDALQRAAAASNKIFALLDEEPAIQAPTDVRAMPDFHDAIRFEGVTFAYSEGDTPVLSKLNLTLRCGEKVALVGSTGAGKSSIVKVMQRLYDHQQGRVTIDGVDTRELDPRALRRFFGTVPQDVFLFTDSIAANIALDDEAVSQAAVVRAAELVEAAEFIGTLPGAYEARLGERGANLSFGERQLLAFARALAREPQVLILDEATSSVDSETEARIQRALHSLVANRTALIIAHRLSTIREVDRIIVLHHGEIREQGSHRDLMALDGIYACLYRLQYEQDGAMLLSDG